MDIVKVFGSNLKKYRTAMGISQEAFADKCGMHRTYNASLMRLELKHINCFWRIKLCLRTLAIIDYRLVIALKRDKILFPVS